jgi:hypothetical protein
VEKHSRTQLCFAEGSGFLNRLETVSPHILKVINMDPIDKCKYLHVYCFFWPLFCSFRLSAGQLIEKVTSFIWRVRKITKSDYKHRHACPSTRPPVLPHKTTRLPLDGFSRNVIFAIFSKICRQDTSVIKT